MRLNILLFASSISRERQPYPVYTATTTNLTDSLDVRYFLPFMLLNTFYHLFIHPLNN